jgi:hypothetical protein
VDLFDNIVFIYMCELEDIAGGIEELDFFDIIVFVLVFELDDIARGIEKLDFS